jgi:hypothetical protein
VRVEAERGFVEQHQLRVEHQAAGDLDHPALPAGQVAGRVVTAFGHDRDPGPDHLQPLLHQCSVAADQIAAISTFSCTDMEGKSACDCGTWVIPRRRMSSGESRSVRAPSIVISPSLGGSSPLITRSTVDFPAPFGPTMQVTVCSGQCRSTPWRTLPPP